MQLGHQRNTPSIVSSNIILLQAGISAAFRPDYRQIGTASKIQKTACLHHQVAFTLRANCRLKRLSCFLIDNRFIKVFG